MSRAAQKANRAALLGCALLTILLLSIWFEASQARAASTKSDAGISIVNGRTTSIKEWPWQIGLTVSRQVDPGTPTSRRFFCGGAVLAPRLVITAGHCVADLSRRQVRKLEVVSGRTRLNSNRGQVVKVKDLRMPRWASGKRRYRTFFGTADWDVALLILRSPLKAEPIKLAGPDEVKTWAPGQIAWSTGWGITRAFASRVPARLKVARQVMMKDGLCHRADGIAFKAARMACVGGPAGNASTCSGDSGGPLVVRTSAGYRLAGLTSYGDGACRGAVPSVDTRVSGPAIRSWVARTARNLTGTDVVGTGGVAEPAPAWCQVPALTGLRADQARRKLEANDCMLGKVRTDPWGKGRRGRIIGSARMPGWLAPVGFKVNVWVAP